LTPESGNHQNAAQFMAQIRHAGKLFGSKEGPQQPPKEDALAYSRVFLYAIALKPCPTAGLFPCVMC